MKRHAIGVAAAIALFGQQGGALAQPEVSANYAMPGCRALVAHRVGTGDLATLQGYCGGVIVTIFAFGRTHLGICPPNESSIEQAIRVVVAYIDARPARLHENFSLFALEALQQAWPCRR
jgi:hypothetical protein